MQFKKLLIYVYSAAGLFVSLMTAVMTYIIIGEPIGSKMFSKITIVVLSALPIIALLSYFIGSYLFDKFVLITDRLKRIGDGDFHTCTADEKIEDLRLLHEGINELSNRLGSLMQELGANNRTLSNMAISFAHDVKTPLTIIDGYLEEIKDGMISAENVDAIIDKLKKETAFINDLSKDTLCYIASANQKREQENIHVKEFIDCEILPLMHARKNVSLVNEVCKDYTILFNKMDLKKIIINLLTNSVKFTESGEIKVYSLEDELIVSDTGIGIKLEYMPFIFEPFSTGDSSKNRNKSGFGLGLSIARNLAIANGYILEFDKDITSGAKAILFKK
ncbi:MAG: HAMP domain-containing sensor histidine kinase [Campylobacterales bacterium]|nr:HAMP domain-containing sensor histidine kinase [Campylobacterales bacterium]